MSALRGQVLSNANKGGSSDADDRTFWCKKLSYLILCINFSVRFNNWKNGRSAQGRNQGGD